MADPAWFGGTFNAIIDGQWKATKSYYLENGAWVATTPQVRGVVDVEPPPDGWYTMRVGEYTVDSDLRGYDPFVDPPWVDAGELTPGTIGGFTVWRFNSNSTRTMLRLINGTIGDPEAVKIVFSDSEEYQFTQTSDENWQSTDNALYLKFRAENLTFEVEFDGEVVEPPPVIEGPPVSNPGGFPVTEPDLIGRNDILYFIDMNDQSQTNDWAYRSGWTWDSSESQSGAGSLRADLDAYEYEPDDIKKPFEECDEAYMRWYRKYEPGFDFSYAHKNNGMYGILTSTPSCVPPTGYDKMSCRVSINPAGTFQLYSYNLDQTEDCGEGLPMNIQSFFPTTGVWHKFEIRVKANSVGVGDVANPDGIVALWVDDVLCAEYTDMRFRKTTDLKWNQLDLSVYQRGDSPSDRKVWNDQVVCATGKIDQ